MCFVFAKAGRKKPPPKWWTELVAGADKSVAAEPNDDEQSKFADSDAESAQDRDDADDEEKDLLESAEAGGADPVGVVPAPAMKSHPAAASGMVKATVAPAPDVKEELAVAAAAASVSAVKKEAVAPKYAYEWNRELKCGVRRPLADLEKWT